MAVVGTGKGGKGVRGEEVTEGVVMVRSGGMVEGGGGWDALQVMVVGAGEAVV